MLKKEARVPHPKESGAMFLKEDLKIYIKLFSLKKENLQKKVETIHLPNLTNFPKRRENISF